MYSMRNVNGHIQVYDYKGAFLFSADSEREAREEMESNFNDKIGSLDEFVEYGVNWVNEELSTLLDFTLEQLALNGCSGLSKDEFYRQYVAEKLHDIPALYDQMEEALDEMREEQERVNRRRVADRHERVAAGENEIGMMLWNGIKRSGDGILNLTKAAMIYDDEVKQKIKAEFSYLCDTMVDSFAEALFDQEELDLRSPVSIEDRRRTAAMMKNLHTGKIPAAKVDDAAFEVFYRNPFTPGILDWAVERYGDENGELQKTADAPGSVSHCHRRSINIHNAHKGELFPSAVRPHTEECEQKSSVEYKSPFVDAEHIQRLSRKLVHDSGEEEMKWIPRTD